MARLSLVAPVVLALAAAASSSAQTPTSVADQKRDRTQEAYAALPAEIKPEYIPEAQGNLGALFNGGNVQGASGKVGAFYGFRYGVHGMRFDLGLGLAALAVDEDGDPANGFTKITPDGTPVDATLGDNYNTSGFGKARYDFFFGDVGSVYAAALGFHDSAANLLLRLRGDVGYRHFFFNVPKHTLSGEVGGVYTIDNAIFETDLAVADTNGDGRVFVWGDDTRFEETAGVLGARVALVYNNALLDNVTFSQSIEVIPNLSFGPDLLVVGDVDAPFEAQRSADGRTGNNKLGLGEATIANSSTQLTVNIGSNLTMGFNLTLSYDNGAISRRNAYTNYDVATAIQLGYKFF
ncbi:MAG TPA: DUF481 domain-containing protein [Myxococcota bacterium]